MASLHTRARIPAHSLTYIKQTAAFLHRHTHISSSYLPPSSVFPLRRTSGWLEVLQSAVSSQPSISHQPRKNNTNKSGYVELRGLKGRVYLSLMEPASDSVKQTGRSIYVYFYFWVFLTRLNVDMIHTAAARMSLK